MPTSVVGHTHLDRALAQSTETMPKCSGLTACTRGLITPRGLWMDWGAVEDRFLDLVAVAMGKTSWKEFGEKTNSPTGSLHGVKR